MLKDFRSGFACLAGRPNVGKSTLLNTILGKKIAIVSEKPQTTRNRILGVKDIKEGQIVFLDTPGIHQPLHKLNEYMVEAAKRAITEVDVIVLMIDGKRGITEEDELAISQVFLLAGSKPVMGVVNKMDLLEKQRWREREKELSQLADFAEVLSLSALTGRGVEYLINSLLELLPAGPAYYPSEMLTDQPEAFFIAEIIREKIYKLTRKEIPYSVAVVVEDIKEKGNLLVVEATVFVEHGSQKGIIIGEKGRMLKRIGELARLELEELLGVKVYLSLWVKVKERWRKREEVLRELGYRLPRRGRR